MKNVLLIVFSCCATFVNAQSSHHAGIYSFGDSAEKRNGVLYLHPNSDSTALFYLELGRGAPSYNSGAIVGQMQFISKNEAYFSRNDTTQLINCQFSFLFTNDQLKISTSETEEACGFGHAVYADGTYKRTSDVAPDSFIDRIGKVHSFVHFQYVKSEY